MNLMIVPGICSRFLISVYIFIVSKALLMSSATVIVRAWGAIWLNPFTTPLFNVRSAVTVECNSVAWVHLVCLLLYKEEGSSPVSAITERRDIDLYEVPFSMSLLDVVMGTSPRGPMCFRCLTFSLSGPCELLCLHCFIASWT